MVKRTKDMPGHRHRHPEPAFNELIISRKFHFFQHSFHITPGNRFSRFQKQMRCSRFSAGMPTSHQLLCQREKDYEINTTCTFSQQRFFMLISGSALFMPGPVIADSPGVNSDDLIESAYPGSRITEQREDTWQGLPVTEIELETAEVKDLEVIVSKQAKLLKLKKNPVCRSYLPTIRPPLPPGPTHFPCEKRKAEP